MAILTFMLAAVASAPAMVAVPAHVQYCSSSNAITGSEYAKPETRNTVFDAISDKIEQVGLTARALTIGVPFVDDIHRTSSPNATPADDDEANATYVIRICSVVPQDKAAAFPAAGIVNVPAKSVFAMLCDTANLDECRRNVEAAVRALPGADPTKPVLVRTRQALTSDASPQNLAAALSDSSIIVLREKDQPQEGAPGAATPPPVPTTLAVVSGEAGH